MILCFLSSYIFLGISFILYFLSLSLIYFGLQFFLNYSFLSSNSVMLNFSIFLDWISLMFSSMVFLASSMIFLYSWGNISDDNSLKRFIYISVLFIL